MSRLFVCLLLYKQTPVMVTGELLATTRLMVVASYQHQQLMDIPEKIASNVHIICRWSNVGEEHVEFNTHVLTIHGPERIKEQHEVIC